MNFNLLLNILKGKSLENDLDNFMDINLPNKSQIEYNEPCPEPTDLRISTITAICNINTDIKLNIIYDKINIDNNIKYIEYGDKNKGTPVKKISKKKLKKKKIFFNQTTIIINISPSRYVNTKIFRNGKIQMTGLKSEEEGYKTVDILINKLRLINSTYDLKKETKQKENPISNPHKMKLTDFRIVLVNTDFNVNFKIKRVDLHKILINKYNLFSKYEPCIYPGVDTKFYYNEKYDNDGLCHCHKKCNGKGSGLDEGDCKKITIAAFQSGSIIITGARNLKQVSVAKNFINEVIKENYLSIKKILPSFVKEKLNKPKKRKSKKFYIKKSDIINIYND